MSISDESSSDQLLKLSLSLHQAFQRRGATIIVVGGSAIELLTDGLYASGDLDLCFDGPRPPLREIMEVMQELGAEGGTRSFRCQGVYIDILGTVETLARTPFPEIGGVRLAKPEDLLVERVLMSVYPRPNAEAQLCAEKLMAVLLSDEVEVDWLEVERIAALPEYCVLPELQNLRQRVIAQLNLALE
jgi:hypothetical protein